MRWKKPKEKKKTLRRTIIASRTNVSLTTGTMPTKARGGGKVTAVTDKAVTIRALQRVRIDKQFLTLTPQKARIEVAKGARMAHPPIAKAAAKHDATTVPQAASGAKEGPSSGGMLGVGQVAAGAQQAEGEAAGGSRHAAAAQVVVAGRAAEGGLPRAPGGAGVAHPAPGGVVDQLQHVAARALRLGALAGCAHVPVAGCAFAAHHRAWELLETVVACPSAC